MFILIFFSYFNLYNQNYIMIVFKLTENRLWFLTFSSFDYVCMFFIVLFFLYKILKS